MEETKVRPNIVEMAKKKRLIYLLEKLRNEKTLSKAELNELEKLEKGALPAGYVAGQDELSEIFGVNPRTIRRWAKQGMPKASEGCYSIAAIQEWRFRNDKRKKTEKTKDGEWELRFRQYKALLAEIEWKEKTGQLIPIGDVERDSVQKIIAIKTKFLSLPRTIAPQLVGLEVQKIESILRIRIEEIINDFASGKVIYNKKNPK